jgi:hypothetical protein
VLEGEEVAYIRDVTDFPGLEMILRIENEVTKAGVLTSQETRYLVTSLKADAVSPQRLMSLVRDHWGVENGLHFLKDR